MDQYIDFDRQQYRALYDDLKHLNDDELDKHWLDVGCKEGRHYTIYQAYPDFDEPQYRALYDDLTDLSITELQLHWLTIGRKEGRHYTIYQAYLDFYEPHYRALYDDLTGLNSKEVQLHWLNIGRKEGRYYTVYHAYPDFDETIYKALYDDLAELNSKEVQLHWLNIGRKEGRTYCFHTLYPDVNEITYSQLYSELKDASSKEIQLHWLNIGKTRNLNGFREDHYQAMYDDLKCYTGEQLRNHWLNIGRKEGRHCNLYQLYPYFNEEHYRLLYDDLKQLTSEEVQLNWLRVGIKKHRHCTIYQAYPNFDSEVYQILYDDLKNLSKPELEIHWLRTGRVKRRKFTVLQYYPDFNEEMYRLLYDDIRGLTGRELQLHWLKVGRKEARSYHFQKVYSDFNESEYRLKYGLVNESSIDVQKHWLEIGIKKEIRFFDRFHRDFDEDMYRALYNDIKDCNQLEVRENYLSTGRTDKFTLEFDEEMYRALYSEISELTSREVQLDWLKTGRTDKFTLEFDEEMYRGLYSDAKQMTTREVYLDYLATSRKDKFILVFDNEMYRARYELENLSDRELQLDWLKTGRPDICDTDFDEEMYRALYSDVAQMTTREVQLDWMRTHRTDLFTLEFDEDMYRALYKDVAQLTSRKVQLDWLHTKRTDKFELEFNENMYRVLYDEVKDMDLKEIQLDWLNTGRPDSFEGLYPDFNADHYKALYDDVKNMTNDQIKQHWLIIGRKNGRHCSIYRAYPDFRELEYQALYPDLKELSKEQLQLHWLKTGIIKRRKCCVERVSPHFNEEHYRALYDDLKSMSSQDIRLHWLKVGRLKNRHSNIYEAFPDFNARIYRGLYEELKGLTIEQAELHWLTTGRFKRRKYKIELVYPEFNEEHYRILCNGLEGKTSPEVQAQWLELERHRRKRFLFYNIYPDFKPGMYRLLNPELSTMTDKELETHWLKTGRNTDMKYTLYQVYPKFNPNIYRILNEKLDHMTDAELEIHWVQTGSKTGLTYNMYDVYPEFNLEKYRSLTASGQNVSDNELETHWLECGRYSDLFYKMCEKSKEFAMNPHKILLVIQNDTKKGINKHTNIIKKELGAHVMTVDINSKKYIRFNANYKLYDYVLWQNTYINLPLKQNYQKYVYIVHSDSEPWSSRKRDCVTNNDSLIDLYIFVNERIKESFEKNLFVPKNSVVIENQLEKIENNSKEIAKLYVSCGTYRESKNYYVLIDQFSKLDDTHQLEIYGDVSDQDYFDTLKRYLDDKKVKNIKLLEYKPNYIQRLKEAEYYCSFSKNEHDSYSLLEAMALNKKIVCSEECLALKQLRYYQKRSSSLFNKISIEDYYVYPDYIFIDQLKSAIIHNKPLKRYVDNIQVTEETDYKAISKEIKYGLKHLELSSGLSFLLRIKNEQLYILKNIFQIYPFADEIIIVDNGSTDETVSMIEYFNTYYKKVFVYYYKISIHNVTQNEGKQKKQIGTFYNWCLSKVTKNNVIKWDGDFEVIPESLADMIEKYQLRERTDQFALWFSGITKFYKKYMNISSYYDEYRCFSKLNGFMWVDTNTCESAGDYVKDENTKRYVTGYDTTDNPVWLCDAAKKFNYDRKPVFIENKNYKDYKEYTIDIRCQNDNNILLEYNNTTDLNCSADIIFIVILERTQIGGVETVSKTLEDYLLYFGKDVRYILLKSTDGVDNIKYYSLESFKSRLDVFRDDQLFIYTSYQMDIEKLNKNNNIKVVGISHSDISYYNKHFTESSKLYHKLIVINDACYQKYKKLNIDNVVLLRNNIKLLENITSQREFDRDCIRLLFFSRTSYDKNVIMLFDAIERLREQGVNVKLDIYSKLDDTTMYYYNKLICKDSITIKEPTDRKDVYLEYDICVLPSVSEGCSMNVLESINYEVPMICSNNVGNKEIIGNDYPMFDLVGLDCCKDDLYVSDYNRLLVAIGYSAAANEQGLKIMKTDSEVYEKNVEEIKNKVLMVIDNYSFYKVQVVKLKQKITQDFYNIKQYMIEINNLLSEKIKVIDYPVN